MTTGAEPFELTASPFDALTRRELYDLLALRAEVFVVEQECAYHDPDGHDPEATHLSGRLGGELVTCARWYLEGGGEGEARGVRLGRIAVARSARGRGLGRRTVAAALERIAREHPGHPVLVHAQAHLARFYESFGFAAVGEPFDDDGIPHVAMVRDG